MKIVLVQAPCSFGVHMPPLAPAYLYATLTAAGYEAQVIDLSIMEYQQAAPDQQCLWDSNNGYRWYIEESFSQLPFVNETTYQRCLDHILAGSPDVIGFSVQNTSALFTRHLAQRIKSRHPRIKILLGGPNCYNLGKSDQNFFLAYGLQKFADVVVVGEGERTILDVLSRLKSGASLEDCQGVAVPQGDAWRFNGFAPAILDLDALPFPDFSVYDLRLYKDQSAFPIMTSRGCVMKCVFCTDTAFWSPYRSRSAENIIAEMELVYKKYGNRSFNFNDSLMNGHLSNLIRLCELMVEKKIDVSWGGNFRIDKKIDVETLRKIRNAGCRYFILGIESASNKVLKLMRKGFTIEEAEAFVLKCQQVGIELVVNWVVGFPGEDEEDFMKTAGFITRYAGVIKRNTFSTLTINQFSYLEKHQEEFGIVLDGYHLGLWRSADGLNTIDVRNKRLRILENIERQDNKEYSIVRQILPSAAGPKIAASSAPRQTVPPLPARETIPDSVVRKAGPGTPVFPKSPKKPKEPGLSKTFDQAAPVVAAPLVQDRAGSPENDRKVKKVSLYIPCFNAENTLAACLDAVFRQDYPIAEVVVVDDGSTDRTCAIAGSFPVRMLRHETNKGLAAARNTAIKAVQTEFVGSLDADCVPNTDWLSRLMKELEDPLLSGAGGRLVEDNGASVFDHWRSIHMKQYWEPDNNRPGFLFGANTVFRRKAILGAGLYDEKFRSNYEDVDIARRLIASGQPVAYASGAVVQHLKKDNMASLFNTYWNWHREYYREKNFFSTPDGFFGKIKDNVGLANRYFEEDLADGRDHLLYLDFFLAMHHSVKDLEYFTFQDAGVNSAREQPKLSSWLALVDLVFFYHYAGEQKTISSLLCPKDSLSLNFLAGILALNRGLEDKFKGSDFKAVLYKHLLFSIYRINDHVFIERLCHLVSVYPDWAGLLEKDHPYLNRNFLQTSPMIKRWMDDRKFQSPDVISRLLDSQKIVERDINTKDLIHED